MLVSLFHLLHLLLPETEGNLTHLVRLIDHRVWSHLLRLAYSDDLFVEDSVITVYLHFIIGFVLVLVRISHLI